MTNDMYTEYLGMLKVLGQSNKYHDVKQENLMSEFGAKKLEEQILGWTSLKTTKPMGRWPDVFAKQKLKSKTFHKYHSC